MRVFSGNTGHPAFLTNNTIKYHHMFVTDWQISGVTVCPAAVGASGEGHRWLGTCSCFCRCFATLVSLSCLSGHLFYSAIAQEKHKTIQIIRSLITVWLRDRVQEMRAGPAYLSCFPRWFLPNFVWCIWKSGATWPPVTLQDIAGKAPSLRALSLKPQQFTVDMKEVALSCWNS